MPDPATGGTLHDAIARALERENQTDEKSTAWHYSDAEAVLVALKEHLAEHPAAIEELGWEGRTPSYLDLPVDWYRAPAGEDA